MSTYPGEIPPPTEPTEREIYERTGIVIGRTFAVMRDGKPVGQLGVITSASAKGVTWRPKDNLDERHRESVAVMSEQRVAWWID